ILCNSTPASFQVQVQGVPMDLVKTPARARSLTLRARKSSTRNFVAPFGRPICTCLRAKCFAEISGAWLAESHHLRGARRRCSPCCSNRDLGSWYCQCLSEISGALVGCIRANIEIYLAYPVALCQRFQVLDFR